MRVKAAEVVFFHDGNIFSVKLCPNGNPRPQISESNFINKNAS